MKIAVLGGAGRMGRWFAKFFLDEGFNVIVSDKDRDKLMEVKKALGIETASNIEAVKGADRILISVPIENFEEVVKEVAPYVRNGQTVMDICSVKEYPVKVMHENLKTEAILGTHPLFGPGAKNIRNKSIIFTPTNPKERKIAEEFKEWFEKREAKIFFMSPRKHDELMSLILGFPHFISMIICDTLLDQAEFTEAMKISGTSYKMLLTFVEAVLSEKPEFYADLHMRLPRVEGIEETLYRKLGEWMEIIKQRNKQKFVERMRILQERLEEINPKYSKSYEDMYRFLESQIDE